MHPDDAYSNRDLEMPLKLSDSYARLRDWFAAVADLDENERNVWIAEHLVNIEDRLALERLLDADRFKDGYFETPAEERAARLVVDEPMRPEGLIGTRIGAFRIERLLGKGGMAAVFLATREAADFDQRVAVKVLRRGLFSEIEQRLFRRERQLLASLEHPNIARLIDGGVTDAGIPYLVIEYVDGQPITEHADAQRLDVRNRLGLFLIVCRAVGAAHRALVVHRDIKPTNIFVTADGMVKLLDFGIAKLLEDETDSATVGVFTPEYAAPEQLTGAPITTATDVYALGVLLHEFLLGVRPKAGGLRRPSSLAGATDAKRSGVLKPEQLARALRGDLDTILLKCLGTEPQRRYTSAETLADDIERHLAGRPVEAHPPSRWYRAQKFINRHRGSVAVTVALILAVFGALGMTLWQATVARHEAARAEEVQAFVESLFAPLEEGTAPEKEPSLKDLLQRGLARVDTSFHGDLRAQAQLLAMFSRIEDQLGEIKNNRDLSDRAYRVAEQVYGANDERTLVARAKHAMVLYRLGEFDAALSEMEAVRSTMKANAIHGVAFADVLESIAFVRNAQDADINEVIALNEEAVREREGDAQATPENLATGYNNLALAYYHDDQLSKALELFQKANVLFVQAKGDSYATASSLANIGGTMYKMGLWREGLPPQIEARAMFKRIDIDSHQMLVGILSGICEDETQLELINDSLTDCNAAVVMAAQVLGESHTRFLRTLNYRASAEIRAAQFDAAKADLDRARAIAPTIEGAGAAAIRVTDAVAANMDRLQGDYALLRQHLAASVAVMRKSAGTSSPTQFAWFALACEHAPDAAVCSGDDVTRARQGLADPKLAHLPTQLAARNALAQIDLIHGDAKQAVEKIREGLRLALPELGDGHSSVGEAHLILGDAQMALADKSAAAREYAVAATVVRGLPAGHPLKAQVATRLKIGN
jgi:eukaryotic-like serine/threonine-protein kinase